jgi:hypothetical protein
VRTFLDRQGLGAGAGTDVTVQDFTVTDARSNQGSYAPGSRFVIRETDHRALDRRGPRAGGGAARGRPRAGGRGAVERQEYGRRADRSSSPSSTRSRRR